MRKVQLYINDKRVDLFKDEKIQITSSIKNVSDISKTFTDFSQTFTVPASDTNNDIFSWWYNNDFDDGFNAKERADARIEINHIPFRRGKVQLEGTEIKNNVPESYKVTFYGEIVTLKDLFGALKLKDLNYDNIAIEYTGANVQTSITSTSDLAVRYPLISSERVWTYGDGASTDISVSGNKILHTELFPAVRDWNIIEIIKDDFNVDFNSDFFNSDYFKKSFTWWKNSNTLNLASEPHGLIFNDGTANSPLVNNQVNNFYNSSFGDFNGVGTYHSLSITVATSPTSNFYVDVYLNGNLYNTIDSQAGTGGSSPVFEQILNTSALNDVYTFEVRTYNPSSTPVTVTGSFTYTYEYLQDMGGGVIDYVSTQFTTTFAASSTFTNKFDFNTTAPDITVADWFSGILKQFNLVCYPLGSATNYKVEPIMEWYAHGGEVNITEYTDTKSIKVDRVKLYKEVSFEWQKSKAFLNEEFRGRLNYDYGNLSYSNNFDGGKFKVKLPFENMLFTKFSGQNLQVSYSVDKAVGGKPIIPKPVKLFMDELRNTNVSFYFNDNSSTTEITQYMPFGQDQVYNTIDVTQNFGLEYSTLKDTEIPNSLFKMFYHDYLTNLFDVKTRKLTVKCRMPLPTLMMLTLDDSILLRDKRYLINSMKTDLTTGEVELVLLSDFNREYLQTIGDVPPTVSNEANTLSVLIKMLKPPNPTKQFDGGGGYVTLGATRQTQFITLSLPATYTSDTRISIGIPRNTTGSSRSQNIPVTYYDAAGNIIKTSNIVFKQNA